MRKDVGAIMPDCLYRLSVSALSVIGALILLASSALADPPKTEAERNAVLDTIQWHEGGVFHLERSKATIRVPNRFAVALDSDVRNFYEVVNGVSAPKNLEAMIVDTKTKSLVLYAPVHEGYVKLDDWSDVDPDRMIAEIRENTENANVQRRANGVPPIHVVGWIEKPNLDRSASVVRWAVEATGEDGPIVNASALVLGRHGYEKLVWVGPKSEEPSLLLDAARSALSFDTGTEYKDYQAGDRVAEYGIAALVATAVGAKSAAKFGLFALIAAFAKKGWLIILMLFGAVASFFKRLFSNRSKGT